MYDAGAARLAVQTDSLFTRGIDAFKSMTPHLKAWPFFHAIL